MKDLPVHKLVKEAKRKFEEIRPGLFTDVIVRSLHWGVVISTPDLLFAAEPAWTDGKKMWYGGKRKPNCWWIHWVSGSVDFAYFQSLVAPTKYFGYERRGKIKIWKWERGIRQ